MTTLAGRRVLVTGAARGLGRRLVARFAAAGARVIAWDLDAAGLEALHAEHAGGGRHVTTQVCDLAARTAIHDAARQVLADHGGVDILINNAGIVSGQPLLEISDAAIERTFAVNALALFWTTRAFLPGMCTRGHGHIVTIASAAGLVGTPRLTDYAASKHAAVGFDDALRAELGHLGHRGIITTVVCPFYVATGMFAGVRSRSPLLPILEPEAVAARIVRAVTRNERRVFLPAIVRTIYLARVLPTAMFDGIMRVLGVTRGMDTFTGRGPGD